MNTPTETPRTEKIFSEFKPPWRIGLRGIAQLADKFRKLERELAAVTKERDDLKRAREINKEAIVLLVKERDEAYANWARLREALGEIQTKCYGWKGGITEELGGIAEAALSTPQPPVVPRKLPDACHVLIGPNGMCMCGVIDGKTCGELLHDPTIEEFWRDFKPEVHAAGVEQYKLLNIRHSMPPVVPREDAEKCAHCGKPATCIGAYEEDGPDTPACDDCCGHGQEDGHCLPLAIYRAKHPLP
jgi:hypothetical protein